MVIIHQNNLEESMLLKISVRICPSFWYQMALSRVLAHKLLGRGFVRAHWEPVRRLLVSPPHCLISHSRLRGAHLCSNVSLLAGYFVALSCGENRKIKKNKSIIKKNLWDQGIDCFACCICHCSA